ncbi:hypothetical protein V8F33_003230 [Rhypophila sp. PSN 637]
MLFQRISVATLQAYLNTVGAAPVPAASRNESNTNPTTQNQDANPGADIAPLYSLTVLIGEQEAQSNVKPNDPAPLYSLTALVGPPQKRDAADLGPLYSLTALVGPPEKRAPDAADLAPLYSLTALVGPQEKEASGDAVGAQDREAEKRDIAPLYSLTALVGPPEKRTPDAGDLAPLYVHNTLRVMGDDKEEASINDKTDNLAPVYSLTDLIGKQE